MKKLSYYIGIIFILISIFFACKKSETINLPKVVTASVDNISGKSARAGGNVADDGGADITDRGIFWGTSADPETSGTKIAIGKGLGVFYDTLRTLSPGVKYYVKAYAQNSKGIAYGNETFFTAQINMAVITTSAVTNLTTTTATVGGDVSDDGGFKVTARGIYWGTLPNTQNTGMKAAVDSGKGVFSKNLEGLSRGVTYYVRAYATNIKGTSYGEEISFTTQSDLAKVTTSILDITVNSLTVGGEVSLSGGSPVTERGVYWGTAAETQNTGTKLTIGSGTGIFSALLNSLNPGTKYYVKAYAINSVGVSYGNEISFTTLGKIPSAATLAQTNLNATNAQLNGLISSNSLSTTVTFEYGTTTAYGNSVAATGSPVTLDNDTLSIIINGLIPNTVYHFRVKAINVLGTAYGDDMTFTTVITGITGTVSDNEGNTYKTIGIGYQQWMTENLKSTKYNNGTAIPLIQADTSWAKLNSPGYCWFNNDQGTYKDTHGAIYNWYTVNTGNLCPTGWHVPSEADITELVNFLGDASVAGGMLKEAGYSHWNNPNTGATDAYGFSARAGGKRLDNGSFDYLKIEGNFWGATNYSTQTAAYLYLLYNYNNSFQAYMNKKYGMSVRCVKD
jgi:uncharacterized protein (TIGR02145 family)